MKLEEIKKEVKSRLSEKRFFHSECVMERAMELAKKFDFDIETAAKVGIAHDIAKEIPNEEKIKYVEKNGIAIDDIEKENPSLLHAKIGEDIVIKELGFTREMGRAIRAHTTGIPEMTLIDKILFIANFLNKVPIFFPKKEPQQDKIKVITAIIKTFHQMERVFPSPSILLV